MQIDKPDRIPHNVGPEPCATADHQRVVYVHPHVSEPMTCRRGGGEQVRRHELVEQAIVHDQAHAFAGTSVCDGKEALTGWVDLAKLGVAALQQLHKLLLVRLEVDPAVNHKLKVGKEIMQCFRFARPQREQPLEKDEQPAGCAADRADVLAATSVCQLLDLFLPLRDQGQIA